MALTYNNNSPSAITYNNHDLMVVKYNGTVVWRKAYWTAAPTALRVNGNTSYTGGSCNLTWSAATMYGATGITYYVYKDNTLLATTASTSYSVSVSSGMSNVSFKVRAYNADLGFSDYSNTVTYTYYVYVPTTATVSASNSFTKTSSGNDYSSPICANNSSTGYAAYEFNGNSMFSTFSFASLHFYVERFPATVRIAVRSGNDSWVNYNTGLANSISVYASTGWNTVNIGSALSSLSGISSAGVKVYFRSEAQTRITGDSGSNSAYIYLSE